MIKNDSEWFIFPELVVQAFPNYTHREDGVVVPEGTSLENVKVVNNELVTLTQEEIEQEVVRARQEEKERIKTEVFNTIQDIIIAECQSKSGTKLYFSNTLSAAMHLSSVVQPDAEIRERATKLVAWEISIDAYCVAALEVWEETGITSDIEAFFTALPKIEQYPA